MFVIKSFLILNCYLTLHFELSLGESSIIGLHYKVDKTFLNQNLLSDKNEVRFSLGENLKDGFTDLSGCLRMKLDFSAHQVNTNCIWF